MRLRDRFPAFRSFGSAVLCGCLGLLPCQGCGALGQRSAVHLMGFVAETGMPAYLRETDLELAAQALAASVKLTEALLETTPDDTRLLLQAVQGLAGYTYAFVEVRIEAVRGRDPEQVKIHTQRAQRLYQRGLQYGLRLLSQYAPPLAPGYCTPPGNAAGAATPPGSSGCPSPVLDELLLGWFAQSRAYCPGDWDGPAPLSGHADATPGP